MSTNEDYTPIFTCEQDFERIWRRDENVKSKCFSDIAEDLVANSFVFKSFRNEFETEHLFTKRCIKELKSGELDFDNLVPKEKMKTHSTVPGYKPESFIPANSSLTKKEMTKCFVMYQELCKNRTLSNELLAVYNEYIANIQKEQKEYQKVVNESWFRINKNRQNIIKPEVKEFINSLWKERLERVSWYPKHYIKVADLSLVDACQNEKISEMTLIQHVKHVGLLPRYSIPNLKSSKINIYKDFIKENKNYEDGVTVSNCYKALHNTLHKIGYHPDVSKDKVAENVAVSKQVQVVISASAFLHLIDNHSKNIGKQWILPVVIKECSLGQEKKKIVFIDKALPRKSLSAADRIKWFAKIQLNKLLKSCQGLLRNLNEEDYEPSDISVNDITKLETFGVDEGCKNEKNPRSDSEMLIDMTEFDKDETENEDIPESKETQNKRSFTKSRLKEKITYSLWSLNNESSNMLLKSHLKTVDVLIRSKSGGRGKGKNDMFVISPKLEYQTEYGAEVVTFSEALNDWGNILIRPACKLLRARTDALTGEVIMFEEKTLQDITREIKRFYSFNPHSRLTCIQELFGKLLEYEPGNYILSHSQDNETFAQLYKFDNNKHTFNLSLSYQFVNPEEVAPPRANWCQIDQYVITPTFLHFHRIPAMFHPKRAVPITSKLEVREEKDSMKKRILASRKKKIVSKKKKNVQHMLKTISDSDT